ncbi:MAG: hypothetical protein A3F42_01550 [Gammaproteobacteria bacterium RIFCSPHIGHO2_12_FULL_37_34]|nr:MAG: hypothetical protein A3F42_01550 [Gammaproteobacteria bacterium RIFCSPHIGHO2_12_FULL_37_34]
MALKVRTYLSAMEEIFLLRKIQYHPLGIGKETWLLMDAGLAAYLMGTILGEGVMLSLIRHFIWNEINTQIAYLIGPTDKAIFPSKKDGIGILPWTAWS